MTRKCSQEMHIGCLCDLLAGFSDALLDPLINFTFNERDSTGTNFYGFGKAAFFQQAVDPRLAIASAALDFG